MRKLSLLRFFFFSTKSLQVHGVIRLKCLVVYNSAGLCVYVFTILNVYRFIRYQVELFRGLQFCRFMCYDVTILKVYRFIGLSGSGYRARCDRDFVPKRFCPKCEN